MSEVPIVERWGNFRDEGIYVTIYFPSGFCGAKRYVGLVKEWEGEHWGDWGEEE